MIALGEDTAGAEVSAHLEVCAECAHQIAQLGHLVNLGQQLTTDDIPTPPPAVVWDRITAELGLGGSARPGADRRTGGLHDVALGEEPGITASRPAPGAVPAPGADEALAVAGATVHDLSARRRRRSAGWLAVAASAGVVVGSLGGAWWASNQQATPDVSVLAEAALEPLPGWEATGVAQVEQSDGNRVIVVQVDAELGADGYREVWLLAPDLSGMVSLGLLTGATGEFVLPEGLDLGRYSVVDVSEEPFDGDAAHSGNSIVRGALEV